MMAASCAVHSNMDPSLTGDPSNAFKVIAHSCLVGTSKYCTSGIS